MKCWYVCADSAFSTPVPKKLKQRASPVSISLGRRPSKVTRFLRWAAIGFALVAVLLVVVLIIINRKAGPFARAYVIRVLEARYNADVDLGRIKIILYPRLHATGEDLTIRRRNQSNNSPPFISIRKFIVDGDVRGLLSDTARVRKLRLEGFEINVPPKGEKKENASPTRTSIPELIIDEMHADGTVLRIYSRKPGKKPLEFEILRAGIILFFCAPIPDAKCSCEGQNRGRGRVADYFLVIAQ